MQRFDDRAPPNFNQNCCARRFRIHCSILTARERKKKRGIAPAYNSETFVGLIEPGATLRITSSLCPSQRPLLTRYLQRSSFAPLQTLRARLEAKALSASPRDDQTASPHAMTESRCRSCVP